MFEDDSYKTNNVHKDLYEALQKSLELDYSNQHLADHEEARTSSAPGTSRASGSFQLPPPLPPSSTGTYGSTPDDHTPAGADSRKDWWKPLPKEERPATPEPAWTILPSNVSGVENNWASALASSYDLEGQAYEVAKIDDVCTYDVSAKYGISHWWFTQQKFYIDRHASPSRRKEVRTHMRILSVVKIKAYLRYEYDYLSEIVLRRADFQEHTFAEKDFKNLYPSDFEDLNLLLLQGTMALIFISQVPWLILQMVYGKDYIMMEMQIPHSSIVKFIATCSYSRLNDFKPSRKNDPKLPQTLISTSSSVCQSDEVMN
ncbi:hypothetical protein Tco_0929640 [Tanacetum coccineum]